MFLSSCIFKIKTNVQCKSKHGKTKEISILGYTYFNNIGNNLQNKINPEKKSPLSYLKNPNPSSIFIKSTK